MTKRDYVSKETLGGESDSRKYLEELAIKIGLLIPQLPALPEDERGSSYYWNLEKWI